MISFCRHFAQLVSSSLSPVPQPIDILKMSEAKIAHPLETIPKEEVSEIPHHLDTVTEDVVKEIPQPLEAISTEQVKDVPQPQRSASADLPETEGKKLEPPPKDRSNSHCFGSPISALLNKLRRQSSYDMRQTEPDRPKPTSTGPGFISSTQDGVSRAARRSIHGLSSAFASLRGKKDAEEEVIHVFNFVSPTLFLYGKDLKQAAGKKLAEWDKIDASRAKEEKEQREAVTRHFIVDCSAFIFLDTAGAASMVQTYREMSARNIRVYYAAARESIRSFFLDLDEADRVPPSAFYPTVDCATQVAKAYRDSPPHITITGLPDDEALGDNLSKRELDSDEEETFSLMFYLPGLQDVINHLIAGNRLCALCFPIAYRKIFTRNKACIMIFVGMLYSIVYVFPIIGAFGFAVPLGYGTNSTEPLLYGFFGRSFAFQTLPWVIMIKTLTPPLFPIATNLQMRKQLIIMFYLPGVQDVINLLIAFNRLCAICFPFSYQKIFTPFNTRLMIPLALLYSFLFVFPIIGADGYAVNHSEPYVNYPVNRSQINIQGKSPMQVYMIAARGITLNSEYDFYLQKRANAAEMRMFLLGFAILLSNVPSIFYQLSWTIIDWNYAYLIVQFLPWPIQVPELQDLLFYFLNIFVYQFAFLPGVAQFFDRFRPTSKNELWMQYTWMLSLVNTYDFQNVRCIRVGSADDPAREKIIVNYSIMFYLPGIQDVVNLLIAFNRFCALCSPVLYRKLNTYLMIPIAMIYSLIFVFPIIGAFGYAMNIVGNDSEPVYLIAAKGIPLVILIKTLTPPLLMIATNESMRRQLMSVDSDST
ncbi:hypothetical protein PRIPAC_93203 [Pristionchus pacificus]|uniref:G protein-coupled receptor n=1 Tax=Pristionchus pacificus TaxID=54126 RepID=A0A2A6CE75_PRIPA|nr:hypothetical protein PRIPAC_93203 [Pristionchus pacificus]|eukprot:PDM76353.1 G protein-coupled receptor [Pristionchus pacificus]